MIYNLLTYFDKKYYSMWFNPICYLFSLIYFPVYLCAIDGGPPINPKLYEEVELEKKLNLKNNEAMMNRLALQHFSMQTYKELKSELDSYVEDRNIDSYKEFHNLNIRRNNDPDIGLENTKTIPNGICLKCILNSTKNQSDLSK